MNRCFSKALFKENLKRFWSLSALGFIVCYFSTIYILNIFGSKTYNYHFVNETLLNQNIGLLLMECFIPVFSAVSLFSYLNKANSVNLIHSLPLTRREMFITNFISGILISIVPEVITAILLIICKKPTYYTDYDGNIVGDNIFTTAAVLKLLLIAFVIVLFVFSVSLIAVSISGNTIIATLTAMALNIVVPVVYLCIHCYAYNMYFGYENDNMIGDVLTRFHPAVALLSGATALKILLWIAISLVLSACAYILYDLRKLERCSDSYVYPIVKDIVGFLFVFVFATVAGEAFSDEDIIASSVIGGIVGFILGQMISRKSFRIFDLKGLKNLIIYAVIMLVVIGAIKFDITGYQKRVPDERNVSEVSIISSNLNIYGPSAYGTVLLSNENNIKEAIALHQEIVDHKDELKIDWDDFDGTFASYCITYYLKNGQTMQRSYNIDESFLRNSEHFRKIRNCDELMNGRKAVVNLPLDDITINMEIYGYDKLPKDLSEFRIEFDSDEPCILYNLDNIDAYPKDGETWNDVFERLGYEITIDKEEFWIEFCKDFSSTDVSSEDEIQIGTLDISFEKSGLTENEARKYANSFYTGASYICQSELSGTYQFRIGIELCTTMTHTMNWLMNNIKLN